MTTPHAAAIPSLASANLTPAGAAFLAAELHFTETSDARVAWRRFGQGPALLLIHGFPFHGFAWRHLLPALSRHYTCYVPDLAGLGETVWREGTDFHFKGHARRLKQLIDSLGLEQYDVLAQDTGATVARTLTSIDSGRVRRLAMINTEMPGHRPPWIREFQASTKLLGTGGWSFRQLLKLRALRRSTLLFGDCFCDLDLLDGEFHDQFVQPLIQSPRRTQGALHYLMGIDWQFVDAMAQLHTEIRQPVLMIWGSDDPIFPIARARQMATQFPDCRGLIELGGCKVLPHEEKPQAVATAALEFFGG